MADKQNHSSHVVPRNIGKIEKVFQGMPDRFIIFTIGCLALSAWVMIQFVYEKSSIGKLIYAILFFVPILIWIIYARSPRIFDQSCLFILFFIQGVGGYNILLKYSMMDNRINNLLKIIEFHTDGTIEFKDGIGWLYAFDCDSVTHDGIEGFNTKAQGLINSIIDEIVFKIEVRVESRLNAQQLSERTNNLINTEKDPKKLAHLKSIYEYSKEKEEHDYDRRYYFFIGITGSKNLDEARVMKQKIEDGLQLKINNLNIIFSQIKNRSLLFDFYAGELR